MTRKPAKCLSLRREANIIKDYARAACSLKYNYNCMNNRRRDITFDVDPLKDGVFQLPLPGIWMSSGFEIGHNV